MFCALSGEVPQEPVVTRTGGVLYEKRLIEKYLKEESGCCPVTGEELSADDLLPVHANKSVRPRPVTGTSIPGLLATMQNEWDELMLETFTLREHLDTTRQELAQALYQHDAACRVIARLMQERDEAKASLEALKVQGFATNGAATDSSAPNAKPQSTSRSVPMDEVNDNAVAEQDAAAETQLNAEVQEQLSAKCTELSTWRRGRKGISVAAGVKERMPQMTLHHSHTPHKADSKSAVACLAVRSDFPSNGESDSVAAILSGGTDKGVLLTELQSGKIIGKAIGHSKKVTAVGFHYPSSSTTLLSSSVDGTFKVWNHSEGGRGASNYKQAWSYDGHKTEVVGFSPHPTGNFAVTAGKDLSWHFLDISVGTCLKTVIADAYSTNAGEEHSCCMFHPDGLILGLGASGSSSGVLGIWDVREMKRVQCLEGHIAPVTALQFSENGYHAATGAEDGSVRLWDLRKLACTKSTDIGGSVSAVSFDSTGTYLAVGGGGEHNTQLHVRTVKDWSPVVDLSGSHAKPITGVAWTADASSLVSSAMERPIRIYSVPE